LNDKKSISKKSDQISLKIKKRNRKSKKSFI